MVHNLPEDVLRQSLSLILHIVKKKAWRDKDQQPETSMSIASVPFGFHQVDFWFSLFLEGDDYIPGWDQQQPSKLLVKSSSAHGCRMCHSIDRSDGWWGDQTEAFSKQSHISHVYKPSLNQIEIYSMIVFVCNITRRHNF